MEISKGDARVIVLDGSTVCVYPLGQRQRWMLGRDTPNSVQHPDIPLASNIVSRTHGWLEKMEGEWFFVDNPGNLNGTFHNGKKIPRPKNGMKVPILLESGDILRIDASDLNHPSDDGVLLLFTTDDVGGRWRVYPLGEESTHISWDANTGRVEPVPRGAESCIRLLWLNNHYFLYVNDAPATVLLNGKPAQNGALLREMDVICLHGCNLLFLGDRLLYANPE